jgi:hypothetical protein
MGVLVTVDLDFFCREKAEWDWGHSEDNAIFSETAWISRYLQVDLYKETDLEHADFIPADFCNKLVEKGFVLNNKTKILTGLSHKDAYNFFKNNKSCELYNFDAHHDSGYDLINDYKKVDCENWVWFLKRNNPYLKYTWIIPKWFEWEGYNKPDFSCNKISFRELELNKPKIIDRLYIAQSPVWVPPHFDKYFIDLVNSLKKYQSDINLNYLRRVIISENKARKMFDDNRKIMKKLQSQMSKGAVLV